MNQRLFRTPSEWRAWLEKNHDKAADVWLFFYKKSTGKKSIPLDEAVEEALCFGWIDSLLRRIDYEKHVVKFTPRKEKSTWSAVNKKRVEKLVAEGRMTPIGLAKVEIAKRNGSWNWLNHIDVRLVVPRDLLDALKGRPEAAEKFEKLSLSRKKQFAWWVVSARTPQTRKKRIEEALERVESGRMFGI
jgi:uncharacterized protein YdeI (YjbR/CyaY-like superfamily)